MAKGTFNCLLLVLLSFLSISASGTPVGFSYDARNDSAAASTVKAMSFLRLNKVSPPQIRVFVSEQNALHNLFNTGVSVEIYLNQAQTGDLRHSKLSGVSWLKTHLSSYSSGVNVGSIIVSCRISELPRRDELHLLYSTLKSTYSFVSSLQLEKPVKVSAAFPLSLLENLSRRKNEGLGRVFRYLRRIRSFVTVEAHIDGEWSMADRSVQSIVKKASLVTSLVEHIDVPIFLSIKCSAVPSSLELADFRDKVSQSLENSTQILGKLSGLLLEMSPIQEVELGEQEKEEHVSHASHRELLTDFNPKTTSHDIFDPPTPTNFPPYTPTPTVVTVPATNPLTYAPTNPAATPVMVPSTTPVTITPASPLNTPVPVTNPTSPITNPGAQPITNPVTTYPTPVGNVPVTNPGTTTMPPPAATNAPIVPGQTWCIARSGVLEGALQLALDYACGLGGADCSMIQQGASCYDPNTLENHASYAFNMYFQKNPVATSCDFGGTAIVVNNNPSSGSCIYPSSLTTSPSTTVPPASTSSTTGATGPGSGSPPSALNTSNPTASSSTIYGSESPPAANTTPASESTKLQPFIGCIALIISLAMGKLVMGTIV
ncbi:hypothetical protein Ancab_000515 [Ancistrocladus abbreviatus]